MIGVSNSAADGKVCWLSGERNANDTIFFILFRSLIYNGERHEE